MYGLIISLAILVCIILTEKFAAAEGRKKELVWEMAFWGVVFGIIGARIYHVVDYHNFYLQNPLNIFMVWNGGLGIIGGIVAGGLGMAIYLKIKKEPVLPWLDLISVAIPLGQSIGRWGNVVNREMLPIPYYETVMDFFLFIIMLACYKLLKKRKPGMLLGIYLLGYLLIRIILQPLR